MSTSSSAAAERYARIADGFGQRVRAVGEMPTEMVSHFFKSVSDNLAATVNMSVTGDNTHHMVEALFKGFGRALKPAVARGTGSDIPSTKGVL